MMYNNNNIDYNKIKEYYLKCSEQAYTYLKIAKIINEYIGLDNMIPFIPSDIPFLIREYHIGIDDIEMINSLLYDFYDYTIHIYDYSRLNPYELIYVLEEIMSTIDEIEKYYI